ncbi:MAG: hypothetical protein ACTSXU_06190 [Promethearchaeota archaeon]
MSYISKIYLKKMFKKDSIQLIENGSTLKITVNNVINPIKAEKLPEDSINNHFEILDDNDKPIAGKDRPDLFDKIKVEVHGKIYTKDNVEQIVGEEVDRGEQYIIYIPNPGWKAGEEHKITVKIHQDRPIEFFIKRTVQEGD